MASVNKVILLGYLGKDPEVKYLEGDNVVANVSLATSESYKDRSGNKIEQTEWHNLEIWGQQAKIAEQYLKKGSQIYVEGKIKTESWDDKDGAKRYRTKIRVTSLTMLGGRKDQETHVPPDSTETYSPREEYQSNSNAFAATQSQPTQTDIDLTNYRGEDDLPF